MQKQLSRSVLRKRSFGNMHLIYRRIPVPNTFSKERLWTAASDYVKTGIWSKSVIKKLKVDERNKSLGC